MNNIQINTEKLLNRHISGFHQYILKKPFHLVYASESFCEITGFSEDELICDSADLYAGIVHPNDRRQYGEFLDKLSSCERQLSLQYRIICKNGYVKYVNDSASSEKLENGTVVCHSVLSDITSLKAENDDFLFLNQSIPCGFIRYTCEKNPRVTYVNKQLMKMLRMSDAAEDSDFAELCRENIYLMIPIEERRQFSQLLEKAYISETPLSGEITVQRFDGSKARFYGWITKCADNRGKEEFQSVCMDITEITRAKKIKETERYLKALTDVYDKIFEYDFSDKTVKCLYENGVGMFSRIKNIPIKFEEATEQWIQSSVVEQDRERVRAFFSDFYRQESTSPDSKPPQIKYNAISSDGSIKLYAGLFLKLDSSLSFFCCRRVHEEHENSLLKNENVSLKKLNENMHELVMRFTDGVVAFEVDEDHVKPLYASDNICEFFGYSKEEWLSLAQQSHSIKEFVSRSSIAYEDFLLLLEKGEAEFSYTDVKTRQPRRIKAVCSHVLSDGSSPRYVMLYNVGHNSEQPEKTVGSPSKIYIRTFGYFDVFVNGNPIPFRNKKSKELLALLVDRRGGFVSSEEAVSFLWEDEPVNTTTLARYRKVGLRLKNILEEYGISDILESVDGKRRVVTDKIQCDLYDYLSQKEGYTHLFKGSYLTNYSWGETTLGELLNKDIF